MTSLIDTDLILKAASYQAIEPLLTAGAGTAPGYLGAARFMVPRKVSRAKLSGDKDRALAAIEGWFEAANAVEPTADESEFAAQLESAAQRGALPFDEGESLLCAVMVKRAVPTLLTGDKRAIRSLATLASSDPRLEALFGRVRCLEQIVLGLVEHSVPDVLRVKVCAEPRVDMALTIIFACASPTVSLEGIREGLISYIEDLRRDAGQILAPQ